MSNGQRIGLLVATVVVLVLAFVVLNPSGDDSGDAPSTVATAPPATATATTPTDATTVAPAPSPQPEFTKIRVRDAKPVGGVKTIKAKKGERLRIEVSSPDTTDEVHLHGYDISKNLKAGGRVRFSFTANAEGIFEMELEGAHLQIAQIEVRPG